jgi:hypothetical protein
MLIYQKVIIWFLHDNFFLNFNKFRLNNFETLKINYSETLQPLQL